MRARSLKRQRLMRVYVGLLRRYLTEHPTCEFPLGCDQPATTVHHRRGRRGDRLIDTRYWAAACHDHNTYAEDHTGHSLAIGWLLRVEGAA